MTRVLADFTGHWRIERSIDDRRAGRVGSLLGQAVLSQVPEGLRYDETGLLQFPGTLPMTARRSYLWAAERDGIAVRFDDGRAFHRIDLTGLDPQARHDCPPDTYDVRYDFSRWPDWTSVWQVSGPAKDYVMETLYTRV